MRLSPLTQITKGNIDQVGRVFTFNFRSVDPNARLGNQSYPVVLGNRMYVTTGESQTWALDATTGKVIWRWTPNNVAVFNKAGIVANRGVAVCDGKVFVLTIDMTIAMLNQNTGELIKRVPISSAVPGAATRYGYSETSAPICARHRVITGAAGSEYGVRGFVMAFKSSDLSPAWANPVWSIPPSGTGWRRVSRIVGGGVTWTPVTVDITSNTVYYGTGSATPLYFPAWRPGSAPRTDSLVAVNLLNGKLKWWQQQMAHNEWSYDTAQPPLVYNAKVGGKKRRVVSVATMEGVWFCYDAATGKPIYQRVKVIDRTEHPPLQPGKPVVVYPGSIGGLNFSPAAYDPKTNYIFNAAAETAGILIQRKLTPTQKKRKRLQGDIFLGLVNGDFGSYLPGWHDHGSISAINVNTGKRVWKFLTPEPERGGVSITASGIGFAGGGDGNLRAFDLSNGNVLWKFQTGRQIAAGPAIYSVDGKEYIAITVGGTPTSSNGGVAPGVQVFAIGGSHDQSPPPNNLPPFRSLQSRNAQGDASKTLVFTPSKAAAPTRAVRQKRASTLTALGRARITTGRPLVVRPWNPNSSNWQFVFGKVFLGRSPVAHAQLRVDRFTLPALTGAQGGFTYPADITEPGRHEVRVVGLSRATVNGRKLTSAQKAAVSAAHGAFNVGYRFSNLHAKVQSNGTVARHRSRFELGRIAAARSRALHVQPRRHDHRCRRQARSGRRRRRPDERPRLLDVLRAFGRERPLHLVLPRLRRERRGPGDDQHRRRPRLDVLRRQPRHRSEVQAQPERHAEHPARHRHAIHDLAAELVRRRDLRGAGRRRRRRGPRRQAVRRALARREGQLRDGASRLGSREDDQLLAEPPPRAVALRRVGRKRDRSPLVAGSARSGHAEPAGHAGRAAQLRIRAAKGYL